MSFCSIGCQGRTLSFPLLSRVKLSLQNRLERDCFKKLDMLTMLEKEFWENFQWAVDTYRLTQLEAD